MFVYTHLVFILTPSFRPSVKTRTIRFLYQFVMVTVTVLAFDYQQTNVDFLHDSN